MSKTKRRVTTHSSNMAVLVGNGVNVNFGGNAYSNSYIIKRIMFNARAHKYDPLFAGEISGEEIAQIFRKLAQWANDIRTGKYDNVIPAEDTRALESFKSRYNWEIANYYDIGLEDWLFILKVFYCKTADGSLSWSSIKQGFEHMILDAIYNDGELNNIYTKMGKQVRKFFMQFSTIFTLNYDSNLEKLTGNSVYHLHGSFDVLANSENPQTVQGFLRMKNGETVAVPGFKHCYCNALLDYEGENKYQIAEAFEKAEAGLSSIMRDKAEEQVPQPIAEWVRTKRENPALTFGTNYNFSKLLELTGELHIIGLSPNNDSHIFRLIEESAVERIVYYYYSDSDKKVKTSKEITFVPVKELWSQLKALPATYRCNYKLPTDNRMIDVINVLSDDPVDRVTLQNEMNKIPQFRVDALCKEANKLCIKQKESGPPESEEELSTQFREISRIALREGILPTVLFALYLGNFQRINSMPHN